MDALENALSGQGRLVMLVGEPGIGKTRTAQQLANAAQLHGALVLWGRCYEEQGMPPYWPWVQAIRGYVRERDAETLREEMGTGTADIAGIVPDLRGRLPGLSPSSSLEDPQQARFRLFDSITAFLKSASQRQPLVLVLDNLHWADKPSLLLLEFLAQELASSRLLVVGTYRDVELSRRHPLSETLGQLTREPLFRRVPLRGLSLEDVGRFIEVIGGIKPPPDLVGAVHTHTEGNPLFVTEVVRLLAQEGELTPERLRSRPGLRLRVPEGVREVIGRRLNRLSPTCNQALTIASVIGREFSIDEVEPLIPELAEDQLLDVLEEAVATRVIDELPQVVGRYQFSHSLVQQTLYNELTTARRARLHHLVGLAMEGLYGVYPDPRLGQLARHFFEAAQAGDVGKAVGYCQRAGAQAVALLAYEDAGRYYEMAIQALELREAVDQGQLCELLLGLGEARRKSGEYSLAMETFQRAADLAAKRGSPEILAQAALGFEEASWRPGLPGEPAVRLLRNALSALGDEDSALRARTLGGLARALSFTGLRDQATVVGEEAIMMARRVGDPAVLATTLRVNVFSLYGRPERILERLDSCAEMLELAQENGDPEMALEAYSGRIFDLLELGEIQAMDAEIEAHARLAQELRQPHYLYILECWRAMRALLVGRFDEGEELAQRALAVGRRLQAHGVAGVFGMQMFTLRREQGRLRELEDAVKVFVQQSSAAGAWRPGLALVYSELGQETEARAEFEHLAANDFADLPQDALWLTCIAYLSEVCAFLGDGARAVTLYRLLLPYADRTVVVSAGFACYGAASCYLGLLAATMSRWEEAERHFQDALEMNQRMGARPWLAHTQYEYAEMLLARGQAPDRAKAVSLLGEAMPISQELGMRSLELRVRGRLEQTKTQPSVAPALPDGLTEREVEVLRLLATGKSNRDIAETLYISLNTVANHVRNILTKTRTANRTEAAAYAIHQRLVEG